MSTAIHFAARDIKRNGERRSGNKGQPSNLFTKKSLGIILVNSTMDKILLIKKRFTYEFDDFVHGRYNPDNDFVLRKMLGGMTLEEKLVIRSLNYDYIWFKKHLVNLRNDAYYRGQAKFIANFMEKDRGAHLLKELRDTPYSDTTLYEFPKGRKKIKNEPNIITAMRELHEEANIKEGNYRIVPHIKKSTVDIDDGVRYLCIYYVAISLKNVQPSVRIDTSEQYFEVSETGWFDLSEVKTLSGNGRLFSMAKSVMRQLRREKKYCMKEGNLFFL